MLKARNREQRSGLPPHLAGRPAPAQPASQPAQPRAPPLAKPEPDYEVVEFPTEQQQYVNAKLQPPPPPPPRPQTGHPVESSCGLCGGGGARVRCAECGRRALCASCDDMYHRHPKRRNHQRQALSPLQLRDERPPLPPKVTPPVPPPRRHKLSGDRASASPRPQQMVFEQRRGTAPGQLPPHLARLAAPPAATAPVAAVAHVTHAAHVAHAGHGAPVAAPAPPYMHSHTLGHLTPAWAPHRGSLTGFNVQPHMINMQSHAEPWESPESVSPTGQWARPLRRGASVLELGAAGAACPGCAQCAGPAAAWRYGSCASLERAWPAWPGPACCPPAPHQLHQPHHPHMHVPHTPHAYRRADSRAVSRAASRAGSRAVSPAMSVRSRASRRTRHRTPSPPPLPSSDADSESESDSDHDRPPPRLPERREEKTRLERRDSTDSRSRRNDDKRENLRKYERDRQEKVEREDRERRESLKIREERERREGRERREQRIRKEETERREESERRESKRVIEDDQQQELDEDLANDESESLGPAPPPPSTEWQCEHCTFVNEPGVRVCVVCCRTPTAAPTAPAAPAVRTSPAAPARISHAEPTAAFEQLSLNNRTSASPARTYYVETPAKQNGEETNHRPVKERASTACGPSPPREELFRKPTSRLVTPTREPVRTRHDMGVGPSPPKEIKHSQTESNAGVRASPYREPNRSSPRATVTKHSVSIGPSPPRDSMLRPSMSNIPKKSDGTSPPRERILESRSSSSSVRANVSNTGTSPPPQSISTQTYEVPNWERAPSASRSRARHRFRDDGRRERSHSRHSLSSDTRSTGGGRWEWRSGRESSPGGEWSGSERRGRPLARRASHLDLRRARPAQPQPVLRRSSFYGSEAVSPEPLASSRTLSLEALALGAPGRREAERGLELARLMVDAERLGFSAAEVHAALAQNPAAPLSWLRERWPSLVAGVRAAAARLAPGVAVPELEARAALARHRGAMWPAVTDCVDRHRRQVEAPGAGSERGVRGRVWGSPAGADNDAAPPRRERRAREDSSDEFEAPTSSAFRDDDWMYLPLDSGDKNPPFEVGPGPDIWNNDIPTANVNREDIAQKLKTFLIQAGVPSINEDLLLKGLLADSNFYKNDNAMNIETLTRDNALQEKVQPNDLVQTEMDFINAYNALTRLSPLPNISNQHNTTKNGAINKIPKRNKNTDNNENKAISNPKLLTGNQSIIEKESNLEVTGIIQQDSEYENESINEKQIDLATKSQNTNKETVTDAKNVTIVNKNKPAASTKEIRHVTKIKNGRIKEAHSARNREYPSDNNSKSKTNNVSINEQEKANNLSEIVDNTQRLIQQMKEEINSDINSLDGGMSQSEADNSSNDDLSTEHESSYSDSEKETDNLTSDDNETSSSSSNEEENARSEKSGTIINRTSSEDNDQFEEAMDHIEEKNDSFKQTNMELLDSIARSLQQEQTIEIEINPIKETTARPKLAATKIQDLNNNLYNVVNSFEEIYDEMNERPIDHTDNEKNTIIIEQNNENILNIGNISETTQESVAKYEILDKQNVQITTLPLPFLEPINLIITENLHTILNATIQNEEYSETFEDIVAVQGTERLENETQVREENHVDHITTNSVTTSDLIIDNENEHSNNSLFTPGEIEYIDGGDNNDIHSENPRNSVSPIENLIEQSGANENVEHGLIFDNKIQNDNTARMNSVSPEKLVPTSPNGNSKVTNKSNIPKLIRITPNNKQKNDKSSPKVISSKVPVRRGSLKQYPAPTPPKMQFGNVQNGHVKQLQTRLFNNKLPKINTNALVTKLKNESLSPIDVRPSTSSTLSKKRPAPQPPTQTQEVAKLSPEKTLAPPKEKNYFRETCRTEDEWTESDSDDSQPYVGKKQSEDEPQKPPSPPPPITLRRVSGQLIDLARIRLLEGSPERQARMLLAEGALENWEQAQLAVELVSRGTEPPAALLAALECTDLNSALAYLHQDCELCAAPFPEHEMVSMLRCTHRCCRECARHYFTVQVTERSIVDCVCPFCKEPELENLNDDEWLEYFAHLDIQLKTLIDTDVHELFQRKLRDRTLARDPNFRWCVECSSGFFVHPKQKKLRCPECRSVSCATCRKPWAASHEGLTCEKYAEWLEDNDPERSISAVQQHLKENGLECPRCRFKYSLSRGGCMHFTCTQCKFEFCYGCGKPFMMGARCGLNEYCARLGLHAHHPRNCLFYLRDKEPHELQTLLQMNNVSYETEPPEGFGGRCPVQLQRETPAGLVDAACGGDVPPNHAGMCQPHYVEYLAAKARALDPIPIMDVAELVAELRRRALPLPERGPWDTDPIYAGMCAEIVREKIPLD